MFAFVSTLKAKVNNQVAAVAANVAVKAHTRASAGVKAQAVRAKAAQVSAMAATSPAQPVAAPASPQAPQAPKFAARVRIVASSVPAFVGNKVRSAKAKFNSPAVPVFVRFLVGFVVGFVTTITFIILTVVTLNSLLSLVGI